MNIIVDAMGGDYAPLEIVKGAVASETKFGCDIILVGKAEEISACFKELGCEVPAKIRIVNATEVILMDDDPAMAFRRKPDSSMTVALKLLRDGEGDAVVSAGSTGALLSAATLIVKRIKGVRRAALAPLLPAKNGNIILIDCGANSECTPEYLKQFAIMGAIYAKSILGIGNPRIGLLNNGAEKTKGTPLQVETYGILENLSNKGQINFIGNIEARDVMLGECDVVVTDGFSGNIFIKSCEGMATYILSLLKGVLKSKLKTKIAGALIKKDLYSLKDKLDVNKVGGTMLLGISKPVIKAHGSSKAEAIESAIRQAISIVDNQTIEKISGMISE